MNITTYCGYHISGNENIAIAINVNDPTDVHWFDRDPEVNDNAFVRAMGWAYPGPSDNPEDEPPEPTIREINA